MKLLNCSLLLVVLAPICVLSQSTSDRIQNYLNEHREELKLTENDVSDWIIYDEHTDSRSGLTHAYVRQTVENIEVYNSIGVFVINGDEVVLTGNSFISDVKSLTGQSVPID